MPTPEGSRGGKVIGHTTSGKPIYEDHAHPAHADFTAADHHEAARLNDKLAEERHGAAFQSDRSAQWRETREGHLSAEGAHKRAAEGHRGEEAAIDRYNQPKLTPQAMREDARAARAEARGQDRPAGGGRIKAPGSGSGA